MNEPEKKIPIPWRWPRGVFYGIGCGLLLVVVIASIVAIVLGSRPGSAPRVATGGTRIPARLFLRDFQRPLDRDLIKKLKIIEENPLMEWVDKRVLKPLFDDVQTARFSVEGVELTAGQFPDRPELISLVEDCARILKIKKPRVYVANRPGLNAFTTNFEDPIVVLHSSMLRRYDDPAELRFIIGHEMGHIRCSHVKWLMVVRLATQTLGETVAVALELPLLKWAREAEMSADNAGLICCQDLKAAERALIRLVLNLDDRSVGKIDVDMYLEQLTRANVSKPADAVHCWRQLTQDHPFIPERIKQLREFARSPGYKNLWKEN